MGLSITLYYDGTDAEFDFIDDDVYSCGITHNMTDMAEAAGIYELLWRL